MKRAILVSLLVMCLHDAHGCRPTGTSGKIPAKGQETFYDAISDVWLGRLPFVNYMCGWPNDTASVHVGVRVGRQIDPLQFLPENAQPFHTLVYFRGVVYEWGAGLLRSYANGTLGRDPHGCPVTWQLYGQSECSSTDILRVAASYIPRYGAYNIVSNNCHSFTRRLTQKLIGGDCTPF